MPELLRTTRDCTLVQIEGQSRGDDRVGAEGIEFDRTGGESGDAVVVNTTLGENQAEERKLLPLPVRRTERENGIERGGGGIMK